MRLGFFPGGVNPRNVTETDAVEHFEFVDEPRGERFILALESAEGNRGSASRLFSTAAIYFACFLASQSASIRGTRVREKSKSTA